MSKKTFSEKVIKELSKNANILRLYSKTITYLEEFKRYFIKKYLLGKLSHTIFEEISFYIDIIEFKRFEQLTYR